MSIQRATRRGANLEDADLSKVNGASAESRKRRHKSHFFFRFRAASFFLLHRVPEELLELGIAHQPGSFGALLACDGVDEIDGLLVGVFALDGQMGHALTANSASFFCRSSNSATPQIVNCSAIMDVDRYGHAARIGFSLANGSLSARTFCETCRSARSVGL